VPCEHHKGRDAAIDGGQVSLKPLVLHCARLKVYTGTRAAVRDGGPNSPHGHVTVVTGRLCAG
jgi:hypothetical protein